MIISIASVTFKRKFLIVKAALTTDFNLFQSPHLTGLRRRRKKNDTFTLPLDSDLNLNFSQILFTRVNKLNPPLTSRKGYIYASLY